MKTIYAVTIAGMLVFSENVLATAQNQDLNMPRKSPEVTISTSPFAWPKDEVQAAKITKQQIVALLLEIDKSVAITRGESISNLFEDVESYRFASLDDGALYLLAVADASPMKWFQDIAVIRCYGTVCSSEWIHSEPPNDLNRQLLDLNHDGRHQMIVKKCICPGGERESGELLHIYSASGGKIADQSANYPEFYKTTVLPSLAARVQEAKPDELNSEDNVEKQKARLTYAQLEVERRVLGDRTAGLSEARKWEQSTDEDIKSLAVRTYEEVDAPEAAEGLRRMSQMNSPKIRQKAEDALSRKALKTTQ